MLNMRKCDNPKCKRRKIVRPNSSVRFGKKWYCTQDCLFDLFDECGTPPPKQNYYQHRPRATFRA
jgi:hypothetical protein